MKISRNIIFWPHLVLGCAAGILIVIMAATGALLAFERQITNAVDMPVVLESQSAPAPPSHLQVIMSALETSGRGTPTDLVLRNRVNAPIEARFGRRQTLFLNPWTGEVVGQPSEKLSAFFASVESIHRSMGLGMRNWIGRGMTGVANLLFLFMLFSGMYLWLPKTFRSAGFRSRLLIRSGLKGRTREWNWHHVVGIWSLVPLFFIVLTGVIMSYPWASNLLSTLTGSQPPTQGERGGPRLDGPDHADRSGAGRATHPAIGASIAEYKSIDDLLAVAEAENAGWKSITVSVPHAGDRTLTLSVDKSVGGQPEKAFQLVINRTTGAIENIRKFSDNSTGRKLRSWARFLHTGEELGLFGQIIAALACISAITLAWTGISMALRRAFAQFELANEDSETKEDETQTLSA